MKAVVIQSRCSRASVGEGGRCYTTSGLPVLPHIGCYSIKDSAKSTSDRSRLKCSDFSHLPSVSIALFHFQSRLSWLTYLLFSIKTRITTIERWANLSVWWALLRCLQGTHPDTNTLSMLSGDQTDIPVSTCSSETQTALQRNAVKNEGKGDRKK